MIRVNYGTPWKGDMESLQSFFPAWYHVNLTAGGITTLIEALSPFTDEPTDAGFVTDEPTLLENETQFSHGEKTGEIEEITTDIPPDFLSDASLYSPMKVA
jgi:hypothetical protein